MINKVYGNYKYAESLRHTTEILSVLEKLETIVNHSKTKMIHGDQSEKEIWEGIIEIIKHRKGV